MLFECERCHKVFNGRLQYERRGEVHCPGCGFLIYREPTVNVYKKGRTRKGLTPLPQIDPREWAQKLREIAYEKEREEEEKEKEERG